MPDLAEFRDYLAGQIAMVVFILVAIAGIKSFTKQEWGRFAGAVLVGIICIGIIFNPKEFENLAKSVMDMIMD